MMKKVYLYACTIVIIAGFIVPIDMEVKANQTNIDYEWHSGDGLPERTRTSLSMLSEEPSLAWTYKTRSNVRQTPIIADKKVFVASWDDMLYCLDLETHELIWKYGLTGIEQPVYYEGMIFVNNDEKLVALDADGNGEGMAEIIWERGIDNRWQYEWLKPAVHDGLIFLGQTSNVVAINVSDGSTVWSFTPDPEYWDRCFSPPTVANGIVYVNYHSKSKDSPGSRSHFYALDEKGDGHGNTTIIWSILDNYFYYKFPPVVSNNYLITWDVDDLGVIKALDAQDGTLKWCFEFGSYTVYAPSIYNHLIYFIKGSAYTLYCLDLEGTSDGVDGTAEDDADVIWSHTIEDIEMRYPSVADNKVVIAGSDSKLYMLDAIGNDDATPTIYGTTNKIWEYSLGDSAEYCRPSIAFNMIFIGSDDDNVYAFGVPPIPSSPLNLQASVGNSYINLSWSTPFSDGGSPIINYRIYRGTVSGEQIFLIETENVLHYKDTDVNTDIPYYYKVSAKNVYCEGPLSDEAIASVYTPHSPIYINRNGDFTVANGVTSGSGTPSDPYIIEGWEIDASGGYGIKIFNTSEHFIIREVYIHSGGVEEHGIYLHNVKNGRVENTVILNNDYGIFLTDSTDVVIMNNNLSNNWEGINFKYSSNITIIANDIHDCWYGILSWTVANVSILTNSISSSVDGGIELRFSTNITITGNNIFTTSGGGGISLRDSSNTIITANTISYNDYGIYIYNSTGIQAYHNNIIENIDQAIDYENNNWDNNGKGNYWSDYTGSDADNNGIGDTSYIIDDDSQDNYPLMELYTPTKPTVPQGLLAIPGDSLITLTWSAPNSEGDSPITNYIIYRGTSSGGETYLTTVDNVLTYTDISVTNDQTYYYKVSAMNSVGEGSQSNEVSAIPTASGVSDLDQDGLPDNWELEHFGDLSQGPDDDYDEDGYNNIDEYQAGTSPADKSDYPEETMQDILFRYWWVFIIISLVIFILIAGILSRKRQSTISEEEGDKKEKVAKEEEIEEEKEGSEEPKEEEESEEEKEESDTEEEPSAEEIGDV